MSEAGGGKGVHEFLEFEHSHNLVLLIRAVKSEFFLCPRIEHFYPEILDILDRYIFFYELHAISVDNCLREDDISIFVILD